jgi:hypothetical protein
MNRDYTTKSQTFGMLVTAGLIGTAVGFTMAKRTGSMLLLMERVVPEMRKPVRRTGHTGMRKRFVKDEYFY